MGIYKRVDRPQRSRIGTVRTERRAQILREFLRCEFDKVPPPTARALQKIAGWRSASVGRQYLTRLAREGLIAKVPVFTDAREKRRREAYKLTIAGKIVALEAAIAADDRLKSNEGLQTLLLRLKTRATLKAWEERREAIEDLAR